MNFLRCFKQSRRIKETIISKNSLKKLDIVVMKSLLGCIYLLASVLFLLRKCRLDQTERG